MSTQHETELEQDPPEDGVARYLEQNPDFFVRHPDLVTQLRIPHECGEAVSLISHQVQVLREQNRKSARRLDELVRVARDNDRLSERLHRLTLDLLDSSDLDAVLHALKDGLREHFSADMVAVRLFDSSKLQAKHQDFIAPEDSSLSHFRRFLQDEKPVCGRLASEQIAFLFGDSAAKVASAALIPVSDRSAMGLLAIGSYQADRFHASQGTVFLRQLGQLAGRALRPHLSH
ncbi:DUF484 family protein [Methylonatrum kenyense]|uniref:DUF484 family protein n=1 Tax=Methylonatrum kenyense TaxID=455253 RepID=UPI0020BFAEBE|nr:DUF484 family protein [Methylonatrum kenyense]MCK8515289.1 DUF484 family protein [Methylonatrum kenyense]